VIIKLFGEKRAEYVRRIKRGIGYAIVAPLYLLGWISGSIFRLADLARAAIAEGYSSGVKIND
jgi:hypothetical protein